MKSKQMIELWAAYARRCMTATNGNLLMTVRTMNLNNKHRAAFHIVDKTKIMLGETLIWDTADTYGTIEELMKLEEEQARDLAGNAGALV
jgi:hypothetical protein